MTWNWAKEITHRKWISKVDTIDLTEDEIRIVLLSKTPTQLLCWFHTLSSCISLTGGDSARMKVALDHDAEEPFVFELRLPNEILFRDALDTSLAVVNV